MYIRIRMVKCGKNCPTCPHGPYAYLGWRTMDGLQERYLGRVATQEDVDKLWLKEGARTVRKVIEAANKFRIDQMLAKAAPAIAPGSWSKILLTG